MASAAQNCRNSRRDMERRAAAASIFSLCSSESKLLFAMKLPRYYCIAGNGAGTLSLLNGCVSFGHCLLQLLCHVEIHSINHGVMDLFGAIPERGGGMGASTLFSRVDIW